MLIKIATPVTPNPRPEPDEGERFFSAVILLLPISLALWAGIIWSLGQLMHWACSAIDWVQ
jgi:hypothetical protein